MKNAIKKSIEKLSDALGYSLVPKLDSRGIAVELDDVDAELIRYVRDSGITMTSIPRLINTLKSCRYAVENNIPGDFVECGVWRGGNGVLARKVFERLGSNKKVWMFDTFEGMTAPTSDDVAAKTQVAAEQKFHDSQKASFNEWCYASIDDVRKNVIDSGINIDSIKFIKGDICETLQFPQNIPEKISVLRLDTDWYASTKAELDSLYPQLSDRGVLIIDDYGHWEGARKAVDEYFSSAKYKPLFNVVDYTGRSAVKIES